MTFECTEAECPPFSFLITWTARFRDRDGFTFTVTGGGQCPFEVGRSYEIDTILEGVHP